MKRASAGAAAPAVDRAGSGEDGFSARAEHPARTAPLVCAVDICIFRRRSWDGQPVRVIEELTPGRGRSTCPVAATQRAAGRGRSNPWSPFRGSDGQLTVPLKHALAVPFRGSRFSGARSLRHALRRGRVHTPLPSARTNQWSTLSSAPAHPRRLEAPQAARPAEFALLEYLMRATPGGPSRRR